MLGIRAFARNQPSEALHPVKLSTTFVIDAVNNWGTVEVPHSPRPPLVSTKCFQNALYSLQVLHVKRQLTRKVLHNSQEDVTGSRTNASNREKLWTNHTVISFVSVHDTLKTMHLATLKVHLRVSKYEETQ